MRPLSLLLGVVLASVATMAQVKDPAPVPTQILGAKKVFISNAGADADVASIFRRLKQPSLTYDSFYKEMKRWGRYELVPTPAEADIVFEISFSAPMTDCGKFTTYEPQYRLSILDVKSHFTLWSLSAPVEGAFRKATFVKNLDEGMATLISDLKMLTAQPSSAVASTAPSL